MLFATKILLYMNIQTSVFKIEEIEPNKHHLDV